MARTKHRLIDPDITRLALCKVGANNQRVFLLKSEDDDDQRVAAFARLIKAADDWSVAYVPVAVPGAEEGQGMFPTGDGDVDVWDADQIVKAAHSFMRNGAEVVAQHFDPKHADGVRLVESAVALNDLAVPDADPPTTIAKGTWYVGLGFEDPELRAAVARKEIDAVSVEGFATRIAKEAIVHDDTYGQLAQHADTVNLDRFMDPQHPELVECMVWCEGRMWAQAGEPPPSAPPATMAKINAVLAKDAILVPNKPGVTNWVERAGGLPKFIADIAGDLITERGKTTGQAIELAVGIVRNWCHGHGNVKADTRAKACAASAEWEAKKGSAHAMAKDGGTLEDVDAEDRTLLQRIAKMVGIPTTADACGCGCGEVFDADDSIEDTPEAIAKAKLNAAARKRLPKSAFVYPEKAPGPGSYPIHDRAHAANALSRGSGDPNVRRAVCKRHPTLPACKRMAKDGTLPEDSGSLEDVELGERVETLEGRIDGLEKKLIGTEDEPGLVAKMAANVEKLVKPAPKKDEPKDDSTDSTDAGSTGDDEPDTLAKVEKEIEELSEEFGGKMDPLIERLAKVREQSNGGGAAQTVEQRLAALESGSSSQQETNGASVAKTAETGKYAGILFDG